MYLITCISGIKCNNFEYHLYYHSFPAGDYFPSFIRTQYVLSNLPFGQTFYKLTRHNLLTDNTLKKITQDVLVRCSVIASDNNVKLAGQF